MWTQFFGALNDNILKNALIVYTAIHGITFAGLKPELLITLITLIFMAPFFFLSEIAGQLADKVQRIQLIRIIKVFEILIIFIAAIGFGLNIYLLLLVSVFLLGVHSTFFGPIKYSALPDVLPESELLTGNAYIEIGTFIAILMGTLIGGHFISIEHGREWTIAILTFMALAGLYFGYKIPSLPVYFPTLKLDFHLLRPIQKTYQKLKNYPEVINSILGISWYWLIGAVILSLFPILVMNLLNGTTSVISFFLAIFTIGTAVGAFITSRLSKGRIELGLVSIGAVLMSFFLFDVSICISRWTHSVEFKLDVWDLMKMPIGFHLVLDFFCIAVCGGLFTVPLYANLSHCAPKEYRSRAIGLNNIANSIFIIMGSLCLMIFLQWEFSLTKILIIYGFINFLIGFYIYLKFPQYALRFGMWAIANLFYKIKCQGIENVPKKGAAIFVSNHVSFIDWMILSAVLPKPPRFVMYYKFAKTHFLRILLKQFGVILIAGKGEDERIFQQSFLQIKQALDEDHFLGYFPEGSITRSGKLEPFKKGIEYIVKDLKDNESIVFPVAIVGLWGSVFSPDGRSLVYKLFKSLISPRKRIVIKIGVPINSRQVSATYLHEEVQNLIS